MRFEQYWKIQIARIFSKVRAFWCPWVGRYG